MSTDYIVFIHGVKTHRKEEFEKQANTLLKSIQNSLKGNIVNRSFNQRLLPLLWGGQAHGSYWNNPLVVKTISEVIRAAI